MGRHDEAVSEIEKAIEMSQRSIFILDDLGYIYARAGETRKAFKVIEDLDRLGTEEYVPSYGKAVIYSALGDEEKTRAFLERAYEERSFLVYLKVDPAFDSFHDHDWFAALLDKIGL